MNRLQEALRAGWSEVPRTPARRRPLLVAGGGGTLGAAVLERAIADGGFHRVSALSVRPMSVALQGLELIEARVAQPLPAPLPDTALIVFDRERGRHGREAAFLKPEPQDLPQLAQALHAAGARRLVVVLPLSPSTLPAGLRQGLASLDEQAVAAVGFEHLVIVRPAAAAAYRGGLSAGQRLARVLLEQLRLMVPQREQPVRPSKVAEFVVRLAHALESAPPGTRVVPPELIWLAAQRGVRSVVAAWLAGEPLPQLRDAPRRL